MNFMDDLIPLFALFCIFCLPVICITLIIMVKMLKGPASRKRASLDAEETGLIQEMHQNLSRYEERLEALETIVLEHEKKKEIS